eukprot:TRINITY_DN65324_c0_g1_i2.p1 TRINITY_DN65324_c0_g1~~TRINITY_DN65324_c0_g1_i2.p1  ORF type:complete len:917 (-),score=217.14 TRINITY_DN65324_c0_g1_i2:96-2846(-)
MAPASGGLAAEEVDKHVDFLCGRFSVLIAQLQKEEQAWQVVRASNELQEHRLQELKRSHRQQSELAKARQSEEERWQSQESSQAATLARDEATLERQAERLRECYREEQAREYAVHATAMRNSEELQELRSQRVELNGLLGREENALASVAEELRLLREEERRDDSVGRQVDKLTKICREERTRCDSAASSLKVQQEELGRLERQLARRSADCQGTGSRFDNLQLESHEQQEKLQRCSEQLARLQEQLESREQEHWRMRQEGAACSAKSSAEGNEAKRLREELSLQRRLLEMAANDAQAAGVSLERLKSDAAVAGTELQEAEAAASSTQRCAKSSEERVASLPAEHSKMQAETATSEAQLQLAREELRAEAAEQLRLQRSLQEGAKLRELLEADIQVYEPQFVKLQRRQGMLQEQVTRCDADLRTEAEKLRRYRAEAAGISAQRTAVQQRSTALGLRLREYSTGHPSSPSRDPGVAEGNGRFPAGGVALGSGMLESGGSTSSRSYLHREAHASCYRSGSRSGRDAAGSYSVGVRDDMPPDSRELAAADRACFSGGDERRSPLQQRFGDVQPARPQPSQGGCWSARSPPGSLPWRRDDGFPMTARAPSLGDSAGYDRERQALGPGAALIPAGKHLGDGAGNVRMQSSAYGCERQLADAFTARGTGSVGAIRYDHDGAGDHRHGHNHSRSQSAERFRSDVGDYPSACCRTEDRYESRQLYAAGYYTSTPDRGASRMIRGASTYPRETEGGPAVAAAPSAAIGLPYDVRTPPDSARGRPPSYYEALPSSTGRRSQCRSESRERKVRFFGNAVSTSAAAFEASGHSSLSATEARTSLGGMQDDALQFLRDFIAREEARMGLAPYAPPPPPLPTWSQGRATSLPPSPLPEAGASASWSNWPPPTAPHPSAVGDWRQRRACN